MEVVSVFQNTYIDNHSLETKTGKSEIKVIYPKHPKALLCK